MKHIPAIFFFGLVITGCSTKKNTQASRMYHELNTRYNVYFNADEAYKETLKSEMESRQDNLSKLLEVYPTYPELQDNKKPGGSFDITVDKTTKAIKLHSITSKPKRDPSKRKSQEYQEWLKQQEFNPFLKNAWLLLGKGEYQNKDYLLASSTFSYIIRLYRTNPEVVMEARLWLAKSYLAMGWYYETEDIFHNIDLEGGVSDDLKHLYAETYADLLTKRKEYTKAIPYVEESIKGAKGIQKLRLKYLLGQLYAISGNKEQAYKAFKKVQGMNTPYRYTFNAKIQQASFVGEANKKQTLAELKRMTRSSKNKDYLDQVYYAIGNIYLADKDTTKAIEAYKDAIQKSSRNGYDKAVVEVLLGDTYFKQGNYIEAQPAYSDALSKLDKQDQSFVRVEHRSIVLDELVTYIKAIHLQDSLQTLAKMPEDQRLIVINKIINELKKKEKEEKNQSLNDNNQNSSATLFEQSVPGIPNAPVARPEINKSFYFYNNALVEQGKSSFNRKWGNRRQEDNWRRQNKQISIFGNNEYTEITEDVDDTGSSTKNNKDNTKENDQYSIQYYLRQIPLTPEALKKSNEIIEDAYFNSGLIYKDKLENFDLAIEVFDKDLQRFPNTPNKEEIYYQLFLIYLKQGNKDLTELYRRLILNNFSDGEYAATLRSADYEWNLRNIYKLQDNLYQQTYDAYLNRDIDQVRNNYKSIIEKYPLSDLMPKFMYLNALTFAQTKEPEKFKQALSELIEKFPESDVTPMASEMLKGLLSGRILSSDTATARGMIWDMKFVTTQDSTGAAGVDFIANTETEYLLLFIYQTETVDKNQLIYDIANYNFSNFVYKTFDLNFNEINNLDVVQVRGFDTFKEIDDYIDLAFEKGSLMDQLDPSIITVPISADNYIALMNGKSLNEYFTFFEQNYTKEMVKLVILWNQQRSKSEQSKEKIQNENVTPTNNIVENSNTDNDGKNISDKAQTESVSRKAEEAIPDNPVNKEAVEAEKPIEKLDDANNSVGLDDILSVDIIESADKLINSSSDILSNPVEGLINLFKSSKDERDMTKEEKENAKKAKREEKEREKRKRAEENVRRKAEEDALKAIQNKIIEEEKFRTDSLNRIKKQEEDERKALQQAKKQEIKERQQARKQAQKDRENELKIREQQRKEFLKQREKERNEKQKARQKELDQRKKQREELLKQREKERKESLKK